MMVALEGVEGVNQIKIQSSVDNTFWDKTKSFLQYKGASVELKRAKTPVN